MRARFVLVATAASIVAGGTVLISGTLPVPPDGATTSPEPTVQTPRTVPRAEATPLPPAAPALDPDADVSVPVDGFLTWAALDRTTGELASSGDQVNTTESMIKAWIVADHLRRHAEADEKPGDADLEDARRAIRFSDNRAAQRLYVAGGSDRVVARMIDMCGLTDTTVHPGWWSRTRITAVDAVRLGDCLVDGTAAGPEWTDWVLREMRRVTGTTAKEDQRAHEGFEGGRWGIIDGLPQEVRDRGVSIKNGWTAIGATGSWHVNCLAVTQDWVIAVLMRYPVGYGLDYGAERCARVAAQLFPEPEPPRAR